jgi:hypothetical protein
MIVQIPVCLSAALLRDWLSTEGVVTLDSAYCTRSRPTWLELLRDSHVVLKLVTLPPRSSASVMLALHWIARKELRIRELSVPMVHLVNLPADITQLFNSLGDSVVSLHLYSYRDYRLNDYLSRGRVLINGLPNLKHLDLNCMEAGHAAHDVLQSVLHPNLEELHLHIARFSYVAAELIPHSCAKLRFLCTTNDNLLDDDRLETIANGCPELQGVRFTNVESITDQSVEVLVTKCRKLRLLGLSGMEVHDSTLQLIASHCGDRLVALEIGSYHAITAEGTAAIATNCTSLKAFSVGNSNMFLDSEEVGALAGLLIHCKTLRELNVADCRFTEVGFDRLSECLPSIEHFTMHCTECEGACAFLRLLRNCKNLRTLAVEVDCGGVFWRQLAGELLTVTFPHVRRVAARENGRLAIWDEFLVM